LASSLAENHITLNVKFSFAFNVAFNSNQACFFGMLQIVTVTLSNLAIDCLFDPGDLINKLVAKVLHHLNGKSVLSINDPDE